MRTTSLEEKEKQLYLFLVAYGGHKTAIDDIRCYLRYKSGASISNFFYLEYFLLKPLKRGDNFTGKVFCPYLERLIKEQQFLPDWVAIEDNIDDAIEGLKNISIPRIPRNRELERAYLKDSLLIDIETGQAKIGKEIFEEWNIDGKLDIKIGRELYEFDDFKNELESIKNSTTDRCLKKAAIKEKLISVYPFWKNVTNDLQKSVSCEIKIIPCPIASNKLFYGYILLGLPWDTTQTEQEDENVEKAKKVKKETKEILKKKVDNFYLPAIILCHHSFYEKQCYNEMQKSSNKSNIFAADIPFFSTILEDSDKILERKIHKLWLLRKEHVKEIKKLLKEGVDHFIFKDHFWGSPKTIDALEEIFIWDTKFGENENKNKYDNGCKEKLLNIKTFLISGGPGTGKEAVSKMVGLFSKNHTFSKPYIFNMAALKPDWLAPPSIAGIEFKEKKIEYSLFGIFEKVLLKSGKENPIIILDELNSLDIDAQGTLLRILENAEIIPIGGIEEKKKLKAKCRGKELLVIGIVNEKLPQLTVDSAIELTQKQELWGNLFGPVLYEFYRKMRRLRDDLFYRFRRGGFIQLPNLNDRREDIPIILYTKLPDDLRKDIIQGNKFIEYDVWDLLTSKKIDWRGNVRQLQTVAQHIARKVKIKRMKEESFDEITVPFVEDILRETLLI